MRVEQTHSEFAIFTNWGGFALIIRKLNWTSWLTANVKSTGKSSFSWPFPCFQSETSAIQDHRTLRSTIKVCLGLMLSPRIIEQVRMCLGAKNYKSNLSLLLSQNFILKKYCFHFTFVCFLLTPRQRQATDDEIYDVWSDRPVDGEFRKHSTRTKAVVSTLHTQRETTDPKIEFGFIFFACSCSSYTIEYFSFIYMRSEVGKSMRDAYEGEVENERRNVNKQDVVFMMDWGLQVVQFLCFCHHTAMSHHSASRKLSSHRTGSAKDSVIFLWNSQHANFTIYLKR